MKMDKEGRIGKKGKKKKSERERERTNERMERKKERKVSDTKGDEVRGEGGFEKKIKKSPRNSRSVVMHTLKGRHARTHTPTRIIMYPKGKRKIYVNP